MREIELTKGYKAIVDDEDYDFVSQWKWCVSISRCGSRVYAKRTSKGILMHREIAARYSSIEGMDIDHENHNCLDNRRENLRICSRTQNNGNQRARVGGSSRFKGVHKEKQTGLYRASFTDGNGKIIKSPRSADEIWCAKWYNEKAIAHFGSFAVLNDV